MPRNETSKASRGCDVRRGAEMLLPRKFLEFHSGRGYILEHLHALLNRPTSVSK